MRDRILHMFSCDVSAIRSTGLLMTFDAKEGKVKPALTQAIGEITGTAGGDTEFATGQTNENYESVVLKDAAGDPVVSGWSYDKDTHKIVFDVAPAEGTTYSWSMDVFEGDITAILLEDMILGQDPDGAECMVFGEYNSIDINGCTLTDQVIANAASNGIFIKPTTKVSGSRPAV